MNADERAPSPLGDLLIQEGTPRTQNDFPTNARMPRALTHRPCPLRKNFDGNKHGLLTRIEEDEAYALDLDNIPEVS